MAFCYLNPTYIYCQDSNPERKASYPFQRPLAQALGFLPLTKEEGFAIMSLELIKLSI